MDVLHDYMNKNVTQYKKNKLDIRGEEKRAAGRCIEICGMGYIIWIQDEDIKKFLNTARHELDHAIFWLYQSRGVTIDYENSEPHTYYAGHLTEKLIYPILDKLIKTKFKRK
jgi:hypothetical protein